MSIKMVVVDMDGTFLNQDNTYNQRRFARIFEQFQARQIHFVVASGSQYQRLQNQFAPQKQIIDFISQNGAIVHQGDDLISVDALSEADLAEVLRIMQAFGTTAIVQKTISGVKKTYVPAEIAAKTLANIQRYYHAIELVPDFATISQARVNDRITKIGLTFGPTVDYQQAVTQLKTALPASLASQNSGFQTELIGNAGIDKVTGIQQLQTRYQIEANEIMTFGDNENDLGMLQMTPWGFAMPNASPKIQQATRNVALAGHNHDGVLATIEAQLGLD